MVPWSPRKEPGPADTLIEPRETCAQLLTSRMRTVCVVSAATLAETGSRSNRKSKRHLSQAPTVCLLAGRRSLILSTTQALQLVIVSPWRKLMLSDVTSRGPSGESSRPEPPAAPRQDGRARVTFSSWLPL